MNRWGKPKARTQAEMLSSLQVALGFATDEALLRLDPATLARTHGVGLQRCEYELTIARQRRRL